MLWKGQLNQLKLKEPERPVLMRIIPSTTKAAPTTSTTTTAKTSTTTTTMTTTTTTTTSTTTTTRKPTTTTLLIHPFEIFKFGQIKAKKSKKTIPKITTTKAKTTTTAKIETTTKISTTEKSNNILALKSPRSVAIQVKAFLSLILIFLFL